MLDLPDLLSPAFATCWCSTTRGDSRRSSRVAGEAAVGATLHKREGPRSWWAFIRNARRLRLGTRLRSLAGLALVIEKADDGSALLHFPWGRAGRAAARAGGKDAASALPPRAGRRTRRTGPITRRCSPGPMGGRRAHRLAAFHGAADRGARRARRAPRDADASRRRGHFRRSRREDTREHARCTPSGGASMRRRPSG